MTMEEYDNALKALNNKAIVEGEIEMADVIAGMDDECERIGQMIENKITKET